MKDITQEVEEAKRLSDPTTIGDHWMLYISWKNIMAEGHDTVMIDGKIYTFSKYGLTEEL
jgi:hypothetical protein